MLKDVRTNPFLFESFPASVIPVPIFLSTLVTCLIMMDPGDLATMMQWKHIRPLSGVILK